MVDVLDAGLRRTHQRDGVMDRVDAHQRDIADAVADAGVADLGPEPLVACGIGGVEADVAEAGDPGIAAGKIALAAAFRPHHQFDLIAGRIAKADEGLYLAPLGLMCGVPAWTAWPSDPALRPPPAGWPRPRPRSRRSDRRDRLRNSTAYAPARRSEDRDPSCRVRQSAGRDRSVAKFSADSRSGEPRRT